MTTGDLLIQEQYFFSIHFLFSYSTIILLYIRAKHGRVDDCIRQGPLSLSK